MKLSRGITYFHLYDNPGYVKNADGKKTVTDIDWLFKPLGRDTLACYLMTKMPSEHSFRTAE